MRYKLHPLLKPPAPEIRPATRTNQLMDENRITAETPCKCGCGAIAQTGFRVKGYRKACYARLLKEGRNVDN